MDLTIYQKTIANEIMRTRLKHKISQRELAKRANVSISTVKRAESGSHWIGLKQFIVIWKTLGYPIKQAG